MTGMDYLEQAHELHPHAKRVLLLTHSVRWGDRSASQPIVTAVSLGQIDRYTTKPGASPDEQFHRVITELLQEWQRPGQGQREMVTIVERARVIAPMNCAISSSAMVTPSRSLSRTRTRDGRSSSRRASGWSVSRCHPA